MEGLDINNILSEDQISELFGAENTEEQSEEIDDNKEKETTEEINGDELFVSPESVGSEEDINDKDSEGTPSDTGVKSSPQNKNFYSSTLSALAEDGVFTGLSEDDIKNVNDAESFALAVEKEIESKLDERQKRIDSALNSGVEPDEIKQNEAIINFLDNVTDDMINDETEKGEKLRQDIIAQDLINKGYSDQQVKRKLKTIFDSGSDIDEAKDALEANKEFFNNKYNDIIEAKKNERREAENQRKKETESLRKDIMENKELLGGLVLDKITRQKIFDNISKPIHKDKDTGELLTEVQLYQRENRMDFVKNLGIIYTLTDGFKNLDKLIKGEVNKKVRKSLKELEQTINSTTRNSDGSFQYMTGVGDDNSYIGSGIRLDI